MSKLIAKLSDGTEWEVVNNMPTAEGSENRVVWLKPLKPEPPKEVWANIYPDGDRLFYSDREAVEILGRPERIGGKALRYVLASEPEKKPREWWGIAWNWRDTDELRRMQCERLFLTRETAEAYARQYYRHYKYEIVRVREVVG